MNTSPSNIFNELIKQINKGKLSVATVITHEDKIIIVLKTPEKLTSKKVDVIDISSEEKVPGIQMIDNSSNASKENSRPKDKKGRFILDSGKVACKFCGMACTPRGATRHEMKCNRRPQPVSKSQAKRLAIQLENK